MTKTLVGTPDPGEPEDTTPWFLLTGSVASNATITLSTAWGTIYPMEQEHP